MSLFRFLVASGLVLAVWCSAPTPAAAVYQCDGQVDNCSCGMTDPYPCCGSNGNCTWWAWRAACCHWNYAMPAPWNHAKYWAGNYASHPDFTVTSNATKNCVACSTDGEYGHVAFVEDKDGGSMRITEMACWGWYGLKDHWVPVPYGFEKFICLKSQMGPYCGDGKCNGNENCSSCQKDCGKCCGNGKCDYGETCSSCEKDCGPCNKKPEGAITRADCGAIEGWALDPDVNGSIKVSVRLDGQEIVLLEANGSTDGQGEHGFSVAFPDSHKDGSAHSVEVIGKDDKGIADSAIGNSGTQVLCRSGREFRGIWDVTWSEAAGIDILPVPAGGVPGSTVKVDHGGELPYPVAGSVTATAQLGLTAAEELALEIHGPGFAGGPYAAALQIGGDEVSVLTGFTGEGETLAWDAESSTVTLSLAALEMVKDPVERWLQLSHLRVRSGPWWNDYSWDAAGLIWGHPQPDGVLLRVRDGQADVAGWVGTYATVLAPFDGLALATESALPAGLEVAVLVDGEEAKTLGPGSSGTVVVEQSGSGFALRLRATEPTSVPATTRFEARDVRVFRQREEGHHPWRVRHEQSWGLRFGPPEGAPGGLGLRLATDPADGWFTSGVIAAETTLDAPPFDRVRGVLDVGLPGHPFAGLLVVDGKPAKVIDAQTPAGPMELAATGSSFGLSLAALSSIEGQPPAYLELRDIAFRRGGWWTVPSWDCAGIRDGRDEDCTLRFENLRWWGMEGNEARGSVQSTRRFEEPIRGVRFHLDSTAEGGIERLFVTLDGKPLQSYTLLQPRRGDERVEGGPGHELGFAWVVAQPGIYPYRWGATLSRIEVLHADGSWVSACEAAEDESWDGQQFTLLDDVVSSVEPAVVEADAEGARSSGCQAGAGAGPGAYALLCALILALVLARNRVRA